MRIIKEYKDFSTKLKDLDEIKNIQGNEADSGDSYDVGLYNGLELAKSIVSEYEPRFKHIRTMTEDKIYKFSEYSPTKYNGNVLVSQIMEWLRAKLLELPSADQVTYSLTKFLKESGVDKNVFMTFYNEIDKTQKAKNFKVEIDGDNITFSNFKNNEENNEN